MNRFTFLTAIASLLCFTNRVEAQKVEKLFNGKDLSEWNFIVEKNSEPANQVYSVRDSVIHIKGTLGYMYTKKKYNNYVLHVEWRWPVEATNSGIFILIEDPKNPFPNGVECQLGAGNAGDLVLLGGSNLNEYKTPPEGRPDFPMLKKTNPSSEKPVGEWNHANIFVQDGVINVFINGIHQNTASSKVKSGYIGLQSEGKDIQFKNITVTDL
ncbi:MAG: DUF1080 domain-containing protein [Dysgonamonadaceae bacterium]|jgi:hypothetical protein|nr:DUF1080 domain-containing protein [Dysgonamonadaceae bacterium]